MGKERKERLNLVDQDIKLEKLQDSEENSDKLAPIVGHAALFNTEIDRGFYTLSIAPEAFDQSLSDQDDVRALFNHDENYVLGRTKSGTLELSKTKKGLYTKTFPPKTQFAKDLSELIARGDVSQMSIGFNVEKEEIDTSKEREVPHFTVLQASIFDVSIVTYPAEPATDAAIEKMSKEEVQRKVEEIEKSKDSTNYELALDIDIAKVKNSIARSEDLL